MNEVIRAAAELQTVCEEECCRFCFIGGLAVQRWGEPRETVDVDLTLLTGSLTRIGTSWRGPLRDRLRLPDRTRSLCAN